MLFKLGDVPLVPFERIQGGEELLYNDLDENNKDDFIRCRKVCANMAVTKEGMHIEIDPDYLVMRVFE